MRDNIVYPNGYDGGYSFTTAELAKLTSDARALETINNTFTGIEGVAPASAGIPVYTDILDLIATPVTDPETGLLVSWVPNSGVSRAVVSWLVGAAGVNSDSNFGGEYIRDYTAEQIKLRSGSQAPSDTQISNLLNFVSNLIAFKVANDISTSGRIPSISRLSVFDAGTVAATLFSTQYYPGGYYSGFGDIAGWAGSLLFPYLGVSDLYQDWIINSNPFGLSVRPRSC